MAEKPPAQPATAGGLSLPALLGRTQIWASLLAALILVAVIAGNIFILGLHVAPNGWLALLVETGPVVAILVSTLAGYLGYYGTWRMLRGKDEYNVRDDAKSHAADVVGRLQGLPGLLSGRAGCGGLVWGTFSGLLLGVSLVVTGLTLAPPPLRVLGVINNNGTFVPAGLGVTGGPAARPTPTPTPTPVPRIQFVISPTQFPAQGSWQCDSGLPAAQTLTLDNSGSNVAVTWQVTPRETLPNGQPWARASQTQGAIAAGQQATITISPNEVVCRYAAAQPSTTSYHADVTLTGGASGAGTYSLTYLITGTSTVKFSITPTQYPASGAWDCRQGQPPAQTITLDNRGSNVAVGWQATMRETVGNGQPWASTGPSQGPNQNMIPAGKTAQLTITPDAGVCSSVPPAGTAFHADITLTSGGTGTYTFTYTMANPIG
jgi:hypothetical protein